MNPGIFELSEEQKMIVDQVREFAQKEIAPKADQILSGILLKAVMPVKASFASRRASCP